MLRLFTCEMPQRGGGASPPLMVIVAVVCGDDEGGGGRKATFTRNRVYTALQRISGNEKWVQFEGFWLPKTVKTREEFGVECSGGPL